MKAIEKCFKNLNDAMAKATMSIGEPKDKKQANKLHRVKECGEITGEVERWNTRD